MSTSSHIIKPLVKDHYDTWAMQIEAVMVKNGTWEYLDGKHVKPEIVEENEQSRKEVEKWEDGDAKAKSDLIIAIDPSLLRLVKGLNTALQVWDRLKSEFASTGPVKKAELFKRISTYKICESDDVRTQLMDFFDIASQLEGLNIAVHPELLTIMLLNALPASFDVFRGAVEARDELPRPEWLRDKILEEFDSQNQKQKNSDSEAMWVKKSKGVFKQKREIKSIKSNTFRYKCFRCHRYGHKALECLEKDARSKYVGESSSRIVESVDDAFQVSEGAEVEALGVTRSSGRWCLDSGCTSHMCNNEEPFIDRPKAVKNGRLLLASDASTGVEAIGVAQISAEVGKRSKPIKLNDTLLVKDLRANLLSVARIADHDNIITFDKIRAIYRDSNG
ncbi:hypothetical protein J437_LFUL018972 [Ladona fulva]|uniref:CCHC-type domain-containing protein n=1 Tax=Ladona fulva TaxID=123851 RepID=A0A8K0KS66_LADFU|nr:hypothetical protein J437_LFUL018972 [Ladona fulva]